MLELGHVAAPPEHVQADIGQVVEQGAAPPSRSGVTPVLGAVDEQYGGAHRASVWTDRVRSSTHRARGGGNNEANAAAPACIARRVPRPPRR